MAFKWKGICQVTSLCQALSCKGRVSLNLVLLLPLHEQELFGLVC